MTQGNDQWIERALLTLLWMFSSCAVEDAELGQLEQTITLTNEAWGKSMDTEAAHGALVVWNSLP